MTDMPMSDGFRHRLFPLLPELVKRVGTPFHIYDERGIRERGEHLKRMVLDPFKGREFFAVKANPHPRILQIMDGLGFGFDCSSTPELDRVRLKIWSKAPIMFTSNNTTREQFEVALAAQAIINIDDFSFIDAVPDPFPELVCFRYNPGQERAGDGDFVFPNPEKQKYGLRPDQLIPAYQKARKRGARYFGLHTMIISNQRDYRYMAETVRMLLQVAHGLGRGLGIKLEFINVGGGFGIPYRLTESSFDLAAFARATARLYEEFRCDHDYVPALYMESGRYMTGSHGVMVTSVINRMEKHESFIGVDASITSLLRAGIYESAYHHITVVGHERRKKELVSVVGSLCENNDMLAKDRLLPRTEIGDLLVVHDTGAHGLAMANHYNDQYPCQELMLLEDGSVELISRAMTLDDCLALYGDGKKPMKVYPGQGLVRMKLPPHLRYP